MKEQLDKILSTFKEFWKAQEKKRKILFISIAGGILIIAVVLAMIFNIDRQVVLYTNLESEEASEIVTQIQDMGITATLSSTGTISVPESQENSLRMQLGTMGYPKSGLDYSIWDNKIDLFSTDYQKRMVAKQQLETRLTDTIETLSGVESAIVTLDIPEQKNTVITVDSQEPRASVVLHLKNNVSLSDDQIQGITNIILNSVSGLEEGGISITDGTGRVLAVGLGSDDIITENRNKLRFKTDLENGIKQEIYNLLVPAYTERGVQVAVNAVLNYDKEVSEDTKFTPSHDDGSGMLQHEDYESGSDGSYTSGGVVGAEPNTEEYPTGTEDETTGSGYTSYSKSWLVNTLKTQTEKSGYSIDQLTVSVMIYKEYLTDDERESVMSAAAGAAGVAADFISVSNLPSSESQVIDTGLGYPFGLSTIQFYVVLGVILVLILMFSILYVYVSRNARRKRKKLDRQLYGAMAAAGAAPPADNHFETLIPSSYDIPSLTEVSEIETKETQVRREIGKFAKHSPEIVAQLLKSWLREDAENNGTARK